MAEKNGVMDGKDGDKAVENRDVAMIPYFAHEGEMARMERVGKRLWIAVILLIVLLVGTNAGWLIYESQFEDIVIQQEAETGLGGTNLLNGTGGMTYGAGETDHPNPGE